MIYQRPWVTDTRAPASNFAAGGWCAADDGDEEVIELRSNDGGAERQHRGHLAPASPASSTSLAAPAPADELPCHRGRAHSSPHALPLAPLPHSRSFAQMSEAAAAAAAATAAAEAETSLFRHRIGSR